MASVPVPLRTGGFLTEQIPRALPWTALSAWASRYAIEGDEFECLAKMVKAMDGEYLKWAAEQRRR